MSSHSELEAETGGDQRRDCSLSDADRQAWDGLALDAAILSRMRSPAISRSNWANDSGVLSVQAPHRGRRIELLRHRHKGRIVRIEDVDDLGEIGKRPGQAVDLVDNDDLNLPGLNVLQKPLERRPLHRTAGQAAVIVHVAKRDPSGMTLAHDIGLARLPLGVERIEFLLEALVGRFSGVSLGIRNSAPPPRQALWREGEIVRLVKAAWRAGYRGLAAVMATAWDTQLSPVDVRHLSPRQIARNSQGLAFMVSRAKTGRAAAGTLSHRAEAVFDAYMAGLNVKLLENAPIFRNRSGHPYSKDTLGDDFRDVRAAVFGASEQRTLADFRRSGAMEAAAGGADVATISAKMANTLSASNALHRAYMPVEITKVRAADVARLAGRRKMRENEK